MTHSLCIVVEGKEPPALRATTKTCLFNDKPITKQCWHDLFEAKIQYSKIKRTRDDTIEDRHVYGFKLQHICPPSCSGGHDTGCTGFHGFAPAKTLDGEDIWVAQCDTHDSIWGDEVMTHLVRNAINLPIKAYLNARVDYNNDTVDVSNAREIEPVNPKEQKITIDYLTIFTNPITNYNAVIVLKNDPKPLDSLDRIIFWAENDDLVVMTHLEKPIEDVQAGRIRTEEYFHKLFTHCVPRFDPKDDSLNEFYKSRSLGRDGKMPHYLMIDRNYDEALTKAYDDIYRQLGIGFLLGSAPSRFSRSVVLLETGYKVWRDFQDKRPEERFQLHDIDSKLTECSDSELGDLINQNNDELQERLDYWVFLYFMEYFEREPNVSVFSVVRELQRNLGEKIQHMGTHDGAKNRMHKEVRMFWKFLKYYGLVDSS